jgi:ferredoxin
MNAVCLSIEAEHNFTAEIKTHDTIAFCYPIFGSRVPRNMREFVYKHMSDLNGKKVIILVTQAFFSGDGARVFTDMFWENCVDVIYAEHFNMPNNINNIPFFRKSCQKRILRSAKKAEGKMLRVCENIKNGIVKKRGFSRFSQFLGNIQGKAWQGCSKEITPSKSSIEHKAKSGVKIHKECTACNLCVQICPVKNLYCVRETFAFGSLHARVRETLNDNQKEFPVRDIENEKGRIIHKNNCVVCYRCVNRCPRKAITVLIHKRPRWQYKGIGGDYK